MNNDRRKRINKAKDLILQAKGILEDVLNEEEMAFDSMPENLQGSQRGMDSEDAIDSLTDAIESLEEIM